MAIVLTLREFAVLFVGLGVMVYVVSVAAALVAAGKEPPRHDH